MRMLYAHLYMYHLKMEEVNSTTSGAIDRPLPFQDFNRRRDDNFVYFWTEEGT